jgi:hypothetical protein
VGRNPCSIERHSHCLHFIISGKPLVLAPHARSPDSTHVTLLAGCAHSLFRLLHQIRHTDSHKVALT